jgi:hypothetical protein
MNFKLLKLFKLSELKCSDVRWNGALGNLNGVKLNERVVKCGWGRLNGRVWSVDKCSEVEWSVVGGRLNGRVWSVDKCSEVEWSVVGWNVLKWSEGLSNRVSISIRRYIEFSWLYGCFFEHLLSYSFGSILCHCVYGYMFCMLLFNFVKYVFLLLCMFHSVYSVSLCCSLYSLCINVCCTPATGCQPKCS